MNPRNLFVLLIALGVGAVGATPGAAQQTGAIQGVVTDASSSRPLVSAQLTLAGTQTGALTNAEGRFQLSAVPAGEHTVRVVLIGYAPVSRSVTVAPGQTTTLDIRLSQSAISLQEFVVTGVSGATMQAKLPFTVNRLGVDDLPVPPVSAASAIQGKVAGAQVVQGSGRPGASPSILLRAPTSINATDRSQEPLYIVDGVILGESLVDVNSLDIESIEVVKGAAAASLYGSRAANGVVQIITRSGRSMQEDRVRFGLRSEYGRSALAGRHDIAQQHPYRMNASGTKFVTSGGVEFDFGERDGSGAFYVPVLEGNIWNTFQENEWPGGTHDHVAAFFDPGNFLQNHVSIEGRSGGTTFHTSFNQLGQDGVIIGRPGFDRQSARVNVAHRLDEKLQLSARSFYSTSTQGAFPESQGNPLFNLTRMPAGVDLTARDPDSGELYIRPDPNNENANPLEEILKRDVEEARNRFLGGADLRYTPVDWLDLEGNFSYDRSSVHWSDYYPKGFQTARPTPSVNNGSVRQDDWTTTALNSSVTGTVRGTLGDIATRTQLRYLYESEDYDYNRASGFNLGIAGIRTLTNTQASGRVIRSQSQTSRSEGIYLGTNFDLRDRYILDVLVRRDGSSLFGGDQRWQNYYRGAAAWRLSEEEWFSIPNVDEFKLRYSLGTAGNRPNFYAQYETYNITDGVASPVALGNTDLRPEFVTEQELGFDLAMFNRFGLGVSYVRTTAEDQILRVPLPPSSGYISQWQNAGTLESNTFEASLTALVVQADRLNWSSTFNFDRTRQTMTALNVPDYQYGIPFIQGLGSVFYARAGESLGTMYGKRWASSCADLRAGLDCGLFDVNDDGYLVYVGEGGSWRDGDWSTDFVTLEDNRQYWWGQPFPGVDSEGSEFLPIGKTTPDYSFSVANTMSVGGFSVYALLDAVQGVNVYNLPRHWATFQRYSGEVDQGGKAEESRKPIGYYAALYGGLSPTNSRYVEDGSFVKLREVSIRYAIAGSQLQRLGLGPVDGLAISLAGRNLHTWTRYSGYDPEVGVAGGDVGSAAIARFDGFSYPNFRTWTAAVEVNF